MVACAPKPPVLPYLTIGEYSWGCGYDWNGAGVELSSVPELSRRWEGPRDVLIVFHFDPVPTTCVEQAGKLIPTLGFSRVYEVSVRKPRPGDPPLIP